MRRLTDGERDVMAEQEADARAAEAAWAGDGPAEEAEADLSPADWWWAGYAEGQRGMARRSPASPELAKCYADGYSTGEREPIHTSDRGEMPMPQACTDDEIPF